MSKTSAFFGAAATAASGPVTENTPTAHNVHSSSSKRPWDVLQRDEPARDKEKRDCPRWARPFENDGFEISH